MAIPEVSETVLEIAHTPSREALLCGGFGASCMLVGLGALTYISSRRKIVKEKRNKLTK